MQFVVNIKQRETVRQRDLPDIGDPISTATPWNNDDKPNALLSFSRPRSSTITIERRAMKAAGISTKHRNKINSLPEKQAGSEYYYLTGTRFTVVTLT